MQKDQLAKIAGLNPERIDFSIPQSLFNLMEENKIPHNLVVYSYEKKPYGELINLGEEFIFNAQDNIKIDIYKLFDVIEEYQEKMNPYKGEPFYISLMGLIERLAYKGLLEYRRNDLSKLAEYNKNVGD
jgi:hypothetical protein